MVIYYIDPLTTPYRKGVKGMVDLDAAVARIEYAITQDGETDYCPGCGDIAQYGLCPTCAHLLDMLHDKLEKWAAGIPIEE